MKKRPLTKEDSLKGTKDVQDDKKYCSVNAQNSTLKEKSGVKWDPELDYLCLFSFRKKPISKEFIEKLAVELVLWARDNEKAYKLMTFYSQKGIGRSTVGKWLLKFDILREAHDIALCFIGDRREIGMIERKLDSQSVQFMMPNYDPDWRDELKRRADQKKEVALAIKEGESNKTITVHIPPFKENDE